MFSRRLQGKLKHFYILNNGRIDQNKKWLIFSQC